MDEIKQLQVRIAALERRQKLVRSGCVALIIVLAASWGLTNSFAQSRIQNTLRVRGLIIEDENGKARILLGAPIPTVAERKRRDTLVGMVVLDQSGVDRLQVGAPLPGPQMRGAVTQRISPTTGLVFNGTDGNERGGLGVQDEGTAAFGLDFPNGREGVHLAVSPRLGFAGVLIHDEDGSREERSTLGVTKDGRSLLKLSDASGRDRVTVAVTADANEFQVAEPGNQQVRDILKAIPASR